MTMTLFDGDDLPVEANIPTFDEWWQNYPRKERKADSRRYWSKMSPAERVSAWNSLVVWNRYWTARNQPQFIPQAGTWLHQKRWEDTPPALPVVDSRTGRSQAVFEKVRAQEAETRQAAVTGMFPTQRKEITE